MKLPVALGGNALLHRTQLPSAGNPLENVRIACAQVGLLARQSSAHAAVERDLLDVLDAETAGMLAYLLAPSECSGRREVHTRVGCPDLLAFGASVRSGTDKVRQGCDDPRMQSNLFSKPMRPKFALGVFVVSTLAMAFLPMPSQAVEEPEYQVVRELGDIQVRQYAAYAVAEVVVPGPADEAGNQAFPILAGYIFGKNKGERKLAMTAPVTQAAVPVKLEMTAPVTQTAAPDGFLVQFVLPKGVTAASAPEPVDARVQLRDVLPGQRAVIRYSGFWSESNYSEHLAKLQAALRTAGLAWEGEPVYARYNAPFTPWFMRRNEIWLQLAPPR